MNKILTGMARAVATKAKRRERLKNIAVVIDGSTKRVRRSGD